MKTYPNIAARIFDTPLMIDQGKLNVILGALGDRLNIDLPASVRQKLPEVEATLTPGARFSDGGYSVIDGIAIIDVFGTLVHRASFMDALSGMTGYEDLSFQLQAAVADSEVKTILLNIASPGGEVSGVFAFMEQIFQARGSKRIVASVNDLAASAAYLIASAADQVFVSDTSITGSIGVVMAHQDISQMAEKAGVVTTFIFAGDHKVDGNPFQALPDAVKARWQEDVMALYDMFVTKVARNMGISTQSVIDTQALTYLGEKAVAVGLAHGVASFDKVLMDLRRGERPTQGQTPPITEDVTMKTNVILPEGATPEQREALATAGFTVITAEDAGLTAGDDVITSITEAHSQERTRIKAIIQSEEAAQRVEMAQHLAFDSDMSAEDATALLNTAPVAAATETATTPNAFAEVMKAEGNPEVGAGMQGGEGEEVTPAALVSQMRTVGIAR